MHKANPIICVVATVLLGCHSPSLKQTAKAAPTAVTPIPFRPMLVTSFGTHTSSDGIWRIAVAESALDFSHFIARTDGKSCATVGMQGWRAREGWLVFIESESRVWAYDGDRNLLLRTLTLKGNESSGTIYSSRFPCAVPPEVFSRLSEPARLALKQKG